MFIQVPAQNEMMLAEYRLRMKYWVPGSYFHKILSPKHMTVANCVLTLSNTR